MNDLQIYQLNFRCRKIFKQQLCPKSSVSPMGDRPQENAEIYDFVYGCFFICSQCSNNLYRFEPKIYHYCMDTDCDRKCRFWFRYICTMSAWNSWSSRKILPISYHGPHHVAVSRPLSCILLLCFWNRRTKTSLPRRFFLDSWVSFFVLASDYNNQILR